MKLLTDWGFSQDSWKGDRGEYWVLGQGLLLLLFVLLPVSRVWPLPPMPWVYGVWGVALGLGLLALGIFVKALLDLGRSLTPLPRPREDGQLVQTGIYALVRHPIYTGVILAAWSAAIATWSVTHLVGAIALFIFFDAKARREEAWRAEKYADYGTYRARVSKLIPGIY